MASIVHLPGVVLGAALACASPTLHADAATGAKDSDDSLPSCVYISSYHRGYSWSDGIERGLRKTLAGHCTIVPQYMDTRTRASERDKRTAGLRAFELITATNPAVVITSDDNAVKYLVVPYLMNTDLSVVFSGVNWTVEEYGFPVSNITGIVEVAAVRPLLETGRSLADGGRRAVYVASDDESQRKNVQRFKRQGDALDISVVGDLTSNFADWIDSLQRAQHYDFVILGSMYGLKDFDLDRARHATERYTRRPTLTNLEWTMPMAHLGFTKINEEHGEWAGAAAIAILDGVKPSAIPLATNRLWDLWINPGLIERSEVVIDDHLLERAKVLP